MPFDRESILQYLETQAERPAKPKAIARAVGVEEREYRRFRDLLREMEDTGEVYRVRKGRYALPRRINLAVGRLQVTKKGHGFVVPGEEAEDVFVPASRLGGAFDGDQVVARIERRRRGRNPEGSIVKILERARSQVVGVYHRSGRYGFLVPEDPKMHRDLFIPPGSEDGAREDELAVARIVDWGSEQLNPVGEVTEVLGPPGAAGVDILAIVRDRELPDAFPAEVTAQAEEIAEAAVDRQEIERRRDFRGLLSFTIDPEDAKDHDDAISIEELENGRLRVGVHIADVSHFVSRGSPIDVEALQRGTSVYLVDRVLPMLPEALSGDLCSLKPEEDRLTLSLLLTVDPDARVLDAEFAEGVIRSRHNLTYEDAQAILDGERAADDELRGSLGRLRDLMRQLRKHRRKRGGLDFDLPEARVILNAAGEPTEVQQRLRLDSHRLIEELMILANETVAGVARKRKLPFIYRIHEPPDEAQMQSLREFAAGLGLRLAGDAHRSPRPLQKLLGQVDGRPEENLISTLTLRSMKQARYSVDAKGHFGLASDAYTHFTSPIRRYPDLEVHRLIRQAVIDGGSIPEDRIERLRTVADLASSRERQAMDAERDSIELKKIEYMERHLGDEFEGTVSGVVSFGMFVHLDEVLVEGLIHVSDLEDDYYRFSEEDHSLIGESGRRRFRLGDRVKVRVVSVDHVSRELDRALVE